MLMAWVALISSGVTQGGSWGSAVPASSASAVPSQENNDARTMSNHDRTKQHDKSSTPNEAFSLTDENGSGERVDRDQRCGYRNVLPKRDTWRSIVRA